MTFPQQQPKCHKSKNGLNTHMKKRKARTLTFGWSQNHLILFLHSLSIHNTDFLFVFVSRNTFFLFFSISITFHILHHHFHQFPFHNGSLASRWKRLEIEIKCNRISFLDTFIRNYLFFDNFQRPYAAMEALTVISVGVLTNIIWRD